MKSLLFALPTLLLCQVAFAETPPAPAPTTTTQAPVPQAPNLSAPQGKVTPPPGAVDISQEPIVKIVANVQPAVVNINAEETVPQYYTMYDRYFQRYRVRRDRTAQSIGSGLIISADGFVLTNAHVVALAEQEKEVNVTLSSGSKFRAQIITADTDADLALLKIEDQSAQYPYFDLSYVSPNLLGETVVALGSPAGYQNSVSHGILSALHRTFSVDDEQGTEHVYKDLIQTDAAINPGNSGGPLIDINGGLVGINSAKLSGSAIENIGFAIPSDIVIPWANEAVAEAKGLKPPASSTLVSQGKLDAIRKFLGIEARALASDEASELSLQNGGLLITQVEKGSPADDAGLHKGMVIVMIGNRQISDENSLPRELLNMQSGTNVRLQVIVVHNVGNFSIQRGGSVMLTAR
jgi:S1-C subfamily serine protease